MAVRADPQLRGLLLQIVFGYMGSQVVHVAARLGLADLLHAGPKTTDELAEATGTHAASLYRLLRGLACVGVVEETEPGHFALTEFGAPLRADHPDSVRNLTLLFCGELVWQNWANLLGSVRTGRPVYEQLGGDKPFELFARHPEFATVFNEAMSEGTRQAAPGVIAAYDFARFHTIVDVGGGDGTLLAAILAATPGLRGVLFDLPAGLKPAPERLEAAGVADRCEIAEGDFFESVPEGGDAYIMKSVIHDWDDERAIRILESCRRVVPADGTFLVLEPVLPSTVDRSPATLGMVLVGDLNMLVSTGGRERTEAEFSSLFEAAHFRLRRVVPLPPPAFLSIVEGAPA